MANRIKVFLKNGESVVFTGAQALQTSDEYNTLKICDGRFHELASFSKSLIEGITSIDEPEVNTDGK